MNNQRRSFLRRAFGLAIAAPAISRIIANGGARPAPATSIIAPPRFVDIPTQYAMTSCSMGMMMVWHDKEFAESKGLIITRR